MLNPERQERTKISRRGARDAKEGEQVYVSYFASREFLKTGIIDWWLTTFMLVRQLNDVLKLFGPKNLLVEKGSMIGVQVLII